MLPQHMRSAVLRYIEKGLVPDKGDFLYEFLTNDLMGALGQADDINRLALYDYAVYLYNYAPGGCYGSPEAVKAWAEKGGLGL